MRNFVVLFTTIVVLAVIGCKQGNPVSPIPPVSEPGPESVTSPVFELVSAVPIANSMLYAGQTIEFTVRYSLPRENYPATVEAALMSEPIHAAGSMGWGCNTEVLHIWQYSETYACRIYIEPIYLQWWRDEGHTSVNGVFTIYEGTSRNAAHRLIDAGLELHYRLP